MKSNKGNQQSGKEVTKIYPNKWWKVTRTSMALAMIVWAFLFYLMTSSKLYTFGFLPKILYSVIMIGGVVIFLLFINSLFVSPMILFENGIQPMGTKLNYWIYNLKNEFISFNDIRDITFLRYVIVTGIVFQVKLNNYEGFYQWVDDKEQFKLILKTLKKFKS